MTRTPTVVISLDLELCWGSFDHAYGAELVRMARWTHDEGVPRLLRLLTQNGISATWAAVGAMMRDRLTNRSSIPAISYPHFPRPWFDYVPQDGSEDSNPEWFGASLVRMIQAASPVQEIGFHSFSHVLFGHPSMTRERAIAEFRCCAQIAADLGISPNSFVFPRNRVGFLPELREAGFLCYRTPDLARMPVRNPRLRAVLGVAADFAGLSPQVGEPEVDDNGLAAIPGSLMIRFAAGWRRFIPDACRLRRLRKGLEAVERHGGVFHVWFHPENLYAERPRIERVFATFCEELAQLVAAGRVRCLTMGQLAEECIEAQSPKSRDRHLIDLESRELSHCLQNHLLHRKEAFK